MSSGPTHHAISRIVALPVAIGVFVWKNNLLMAVSAGIACFLSGCGPDRDQAEAHLPLAWKIGGWALWIAAIAALMWWLKDAPSQ